MAEDDSKNAHNLSEAIIKALVFFDLFDYPLTAFELWVNLEKRWSLAKIEELLDDKSPLLTAIIGRRDGLYFLSGREGIVAVRQERHNYSARKIKIAHSFVRLFSLFPAVRMIALANSIGQNNLRDGSDIDFFIICSPRRLWLTRLYCTGLTAILNRRPKSEDKRDKICLSFYLSADRLDISDLGLAGGDPYFDHWRRALILLYNKKETYEKFLRANGLAELSGFREAENQTAGTFGNRLEAWAKRLQLAIMPASLKAAMSSSEGVVINDSILKLYLRDRRREFSEKYGNKINQILKENN